MLHLTLILIFAPSVARRLNILASLRLTHVSRINDNLHQHIHQSPVQTGSQESDSQPHQFISRQALRENVFYPRDMEQQSPRLFPQQQHSQQSNINTGQNQPSSNIWGSLNQCQTCTTFTPINWCVKTLTPKYLVYCVSYAKYLEYHHPYTKNSGVL